MAGKYKAYPEYRDSGVEWVGEIPKSWDFFSGKRLFSNRREPASPSDQQLAASQKYGVIPQKMMMAKEGAKVMLALKGTSSFRHVEENDFVISLRSFEGGVEFSSYAGCVSPAYTVLEPKPKVAPSFFKGLLKSPSFISALQSTTDSLRDGKAISYAQFGGIELPLPSKSEQIQIARFLDHETGKIDLLIEKQQELIVLLKEKRQAVISHAVTKGLNPQARLKDSGIEWLGFVPEHWEVKRLKSLCDAGKDQGIQIGPFGGMLTNLQYGEAGEVRVFGQENVLQNDFSIGERWISAARLKSLSKYTPRFGDILFTRKGSIGGCSVFPKNARVGVIDSDTIRLRVDGGLIDTSYLIMSFRESTYLETQIHLMKRGAILSGLNTEIIENLVFTIPPINEQKEIMMHLSTCLKKFKTLDLHAEIQIALLQERRTALISAAVTGKIDVRDWEPSENLVETA